MSIEQQARLPRAARSRRELLPLAGSTYRGTRGGRWTNSDAKWVTNSVRMITTARYYAENTVGFRVARSPGYGDFDGDDDVDTDDHAFVASAMTGPVETVTPGSGHEACDCGGAGVEDGSSHRPRMPTNGAPGPMKTPAPHLLSSRPGTRTVTH